MQKYNDGELEKGFIMANPKEGIYDADETLLYVSQSCDSVMNHLQVQ